MEIKMTDNAVEAMKEKLQSKGENYGARIYLAGVG